MKRAWAVLTSMRTALVLLFLLALAAVPGAAFPQRGLNPEKVTEYYREHPALAPIVDKLWGFDVFAAPWFAAIYLLLFVSLLGCLASRIPVYVRALITGPPATPANLARLPQHTELGTYEDTPANIARSLARTLRRARWTRLSTGEMTISAERGYVRELGNLVFHLSLLAVLIGVGIGALWGWTGGMLVMERATICNTVQAYDQFRPGRLIKAKALPPFCMQLDDFNARYLTNGQPTTYTADVRYRAGESAAATTPNAHYRLSVNHPLRMDKAGVYLINHGYAPILRYKDRFGTVFESPTAFLPQDDRLTSEGVLALPDANQDPNNSQKTPNVQVAFEGIYLPTAPENGPFVRSTHPQQRHEGITLLAYRGDTGMNAGIPRSVYSLDQRQIDDGKLTSIGSKFLKTGETWTLDDGTEVMFLGAREWMSVEVAHDPGRPIALAGAIGMVAGLLASLFVRRRRLFVRLEPNPGSPEQTRVTIGGLARTGAEAYQREFTRLAHKLDQAIASSGSRPSVAATSTSRPTSDPTSEKD